MKMSDPDTASTSREDETTLREKDVSFQSIAGLSIKRCWFFVVGLWGKTISSSRHMFVRFPTANETILA